MNVKVLFGKKLKRKAILKTPVEQIGAWAFSFYWNNIETTDSSFEDLLLTLNTMELGPEFEFSYEELEDIADRLIVAEDVVL